MRCLSFVFCLALLSEAGVLSAIVCAPGYTCFQPSPAPQSSDTIVWVMQNAGNVNGPNCAQVCTTALSGNKQQFYACDTARNDTFNINTFAPIATGLGFTCKPGGCWNSIAPGQGMIMVSIAGNTSKTCYFPATSSTPLAQLAGLQSQISDVAVCTNDPGNANCFGERYSLVCPCVLRALDAACPWPSTGSSLLPYDAPIATWQPPTPPYTNTTCLERINYWRKKACADGWPECPPAGLPPMVECTACHNCVNSQAQYDSVHGAHSSFTRCSELVQGEGGGATCADVIDGFVSERLQPQNNGTCVGHCGPIVAHGCQSFFWGRSMKTGFYTLNWGSCNPTTCSNYCNANAATGSCFSDEFSIAPPSSNSPSMAASTRLTSLSTLIACACAVVSLVIIFRA